MRWMIAATSLACVTASTAGADPLDVPGRPSAVEPSEAAALAYHPVPVRGGAVDVAPDEATYDLFHPVPRDQLRPLSVDESPTTLDAGHVQGEFDVAVVGVDRAGGARSLATAFMASRVRLGLSGRLEAQLVIAPYAQARTEVDGVVTRTAGYDGTTARIKVNLWGNDGGRTALGVVPYVRFDADGLGVGLGAPLGVDLGRGFGLTVVPQLDQTPDGTSGSATFTIGHAVVGPLAAQVETSLVADDVVLDTLGVQANGGLCLLIGEDVELDAGSRFGVRGELPDVEMFVRVSARR